MLWMRVMLCVCVGGVTVVVDSGSFYMTDCYTFPVVLDNVAQGWCNNVVLISSSSASDTQLQVSDTLAPVLPLHISVNVNQKLLTWLE